jgi:hypothetical protein
MPLAYGNVGRVRAVEIHPRYDPLIAATPLHYRFKIHGFSFEVLKVPVKNSQPAKLLFAA